MAVALVIFKWTYVSLSVFWNLDWTKPQDYFSWEFLKWVAAASQADVLFTIGAGVLASIALWIFRRHQRMIRWIAYGFIFVGCVSILYALISRQVFSFFAAPATYQLLSLVGDLSKLRSSIEPFVSIPIVLAVVSMPGVYVILVLASTKLAQRLGSRGLIAGKLIGVSGLVVWILLGQELRTSGFFTFQDRYLADSPHWTMIQSSFFEISNTRVKLSSTTVDSEFLCEYAQKTETPTTNVSSNSTFPGVKSRPRNVILIILESVGTQYLSLYGSSINTTPFLLEEAENSLIFDAYYAPVGWTAYALTSLVLSQRPPMKRYNTMSFTLTGLRGKTLASELSEAGYRTAFMSAGDPEWASEGFFEGKGFQEVLGPGHLDGDQQLSSWGKPDSTLFESMINWIERHREEPFFLMAWTDQTHHPYKLAPGQEEIELLPGKRGTRLGRYLTLIREVDTQIGKLLDVLRHYDLDNDTLVVITGDHGESFGDVRPTEGHGFTVYDEEVKVPLILWNPRLFGNADRSSVVGSHVDLNATIFDVLGRETPAGWDGQSLLAPERSSRAYLFAAAWGQYLLGVRENEWKYIYDARRGLEELYNLVDDPVELHNVAAEFPDRSHDQRQHLAAWLRAEQLRSEGHFPTCE
ncbi:sulfatase-like hydrolase/transferase [Pseudomonadota bacterium]